jgi:hypothetical protein
MTLNKNNHYHLTKYDSGRQIAENLSGIETM